MSAPSSDYERGYADGFADAHNEAIPNVLTLVRLYLDDPTSNINRVTLLGLLNRLETPK